MKRKTRLIVFCIVAMLTVLVLAQPTTASADMGPKPSINVTFKNLDDEPCFVTILSEYKSSGPFSAYDPKVDNRELGGFDSNYYSDENYVNEEAELSWQAFVDYEDKDGYYFLQRWWKLGGESNRISWGYHPPYSFKVVVYYPENNVFIASDIYERYAFDSYYTVDMSSVDGARLLLSKSYDYFGEIIGLLCRIALTILIELLIALLFRLKGRRVMLTVFAVNTVTQIALNVALNLINYFRGALAYLVAFVLLEIAVVVIEAVAYSILLRKCGVPVWKSLLYAVVANVVSAVSGFYLAEWLPGMF